MIQYAWMLCAASVIASVAAAASTDTVQPTKNYVLSGEVLIYTPAMSGLPLKTVLAPRGASAESDLLLRIESISDVGTTANSVTRFASSPLVHGRQPLVMGGLTDSPLEIGDVSLHLDGGAWTFFAEGVEMKGRPVFTITPESLSVRNLTANEFAVSGELVLHEAMAAELGLRGAPPAPLGSVTLVASTYPGLQPTVAGAAVQWLPTVQTSAATVPGPDVIVSTIGPSFSENGTIGTISAYSVTTVSCNIGTQEAIWIDTGAQPNRHPVIGTQIYRYKTVNGSGRFEQIGISWLKHGFCAADAPNCGLPYLPNPSCDWLGLFATDTYSSGLNGDQANLGPRSEIQPWTGVYPYPYILAPGATGNFIYKRTQAAVSDVDPAQNAGALYWGDVVYICTDEPDGNKYNNYSNRTATVGALTGGTWNMSFTGVTNTQQAAIQRWPLTEAGVSLVTVDVPGDGRLYVGGKATSIGGGLWHYEYLVFNMNCHDSVRQVQVPANASVTATNVGFHDVNYHSGEPYSGTDWPGAKVGPNVEWSTSTFGTNANANAIRWSTTYNFRFDCDAAPVTGNVTLGLFRSGGTATAVGLPVPGNGGPASFAYCFGDGTGTACPCGNNSVLGNNEGCLNSLGTGGSLTASGNASLSADTLILTGNGMPDSSALYFQGTAKVANGNGGVFGDGLRCAGGSVIRMTVTTNALGTSQTPGPGEPAVSVLGLVGAPGLRYYQCWYRNAQFFCAPETFNLTNGFQIAWQP